MENQGFSQRARAWLSVSACTKGIKLLFFYLYANKTHVSTNEYRFNRQTCPGIQSVPTLDFNSGRPSAVVETPSDYY